MCQKSRNKGLYEAIQKSSIKTAHLFSHGLVIVKPVQDFRVHKLHQFVLVGVRPTMDQIVFELIDVKFAVQVTDSSKLAGSVLSPDLGVCVDVLMRQNKQLKRKDIIRDGRIIRHEVQ